MATVGTLTSNLFGVNKCYTMTLKKQNISMKVVSFNANNSSYTLNEQGNIFEIYNLEESEIKSIIEIDCLEMPGAICEMK